VLLATSGTGPDPMPSGVIGPWQGFVAWLATS
jgi:hypothetical protein